ncbi:RAD51 associated protein 2 [Cricetulus griseus]
MSLSRPAWPAGPAWPVSSARPPEDSAAKSPRSSKRPRLEEPAYVCEAGWPPLVVPRLSEVEKVWEWSPRPFSAFLVPQNQGSSDSGGQRCELGWQNRTFQMQPLVVPRLSEAEKVWEWSPRPFTEFLVPKNLGSSDSGGQRCDLGWQGRTFQRQSSWQSRTSGAAGCWRAMGRSREPGLQGRDTLGVRRGDTAQNNCGHISEKYYESGMYNQDLDIVRKQKHKTPHFKFIFEDVFNIQQLGTLFSQNTIYSDQMNAMVITQKLSLENLLGEIGWKISDFIVKKDIKVLGSLRSCQVHKAINTEKEEDNSPPIGRVSSVQLASRVKKNGNMGETKSANQNKGTNTKEDGGILQESELAHSKRFCPENDSTLYADHQFESDSSRENNGCFQGLTTKCLSTETLPTAKDFEMKSKFDLVLEELRMFHEISKEDEIPNIPETNNRKENYYGESNDVKEARIEIEKDLEMVEVNKRKVPCLPCDMKAGPTQHKRQQGLFTWKTIPTHGGQAVPNEYCVRSEEEVLHSTPEEGMPFILKFLT